MDFKLPEEIRFILDKFTKQNYEIYIVGGAVRDLIMKRSISDWDFTTNATPQEIIKIFPEGFYDNKFGTVGLSAQALLDYLPHLKLSETAYQIFEITTMRKEAGYEDLRHPEQIIWTNKIEEDLARRDFTINAIALSASLEIIDPFNGLADIKNKLIKTVGEADKRFQEDALRLMRTIRLSAQLGFSIANETLKAISQNASLIKQISMERIRDELLKILASQNPYEGILKLKETGILALILPEVEKTFGVKQEGPKHARVYDIGEHSLLTLKYTPSQDPITRLAALLHDVGKPETVKAEENGNITFYNHDVVGGELVSEIAKRFHLSKNQTDKLYRLVRWHLFSVSEDQTDSALRRFIKNVGVENIPDMMALRIGDRLGGGTQTAISWRMEKFQDRLNKLLEKPFTISDLKVNGHDVMKLLDLSPCPKVGEILEALFAEVLENPDKNERDYLEKRILELGK